MPNTLERILQLQNDLLSDICLMYEQGMTVPDGLSVHAEMLSDFTAKLVRESTTEVVVPVKSLNSLLTSVDADLRKIDTIRCDLTAEIDERSERGHGLPEDIVHRIKIIEDYFMQVITKVEVALELLQGDDDDAEDINAEALGGTKRGAPR